MNICIMRYETEEILMQINDATAAQASVYSHTKHLQFLDEDWSRQTTVMNAEKDTLYVFVTELDSWH